MRVAIVHYWLTSMRGGEKVLEALCELFPDADIFTHAYDPSKLSATITKHRVQTTRIQSLPFAKKHFRAYLPLMPWALKQLDLHDYDLVISSESGPAKGVRAPHATHLCYCHTPMRYIWDMFETYRAQAGFFTRMIMPPVAQYLRMWDYASAQNVTAFAVNSKFVGERVRKFYNRDSQVIYPPVDVERFNHRRKRGDFYLALSQLVPYKKTELIAEAFTKLKLPLIVIGDGPDFQKVRRVSGPNVQLLRWQPDEVVREHLETCKALVFAAEEDFGIVPVEAQAAGAPVIAFGRGGALESVITGETGIFFKEQNVESLCDAVDQFKKLSFDVKRLRGNAERFEKERFKREFSEFVQHNIQKH